MIGLATQATVILFTGGQCPNIIEFNLFCSIPFTLNADVLLGSPNTTTMIKAMMMITQHYCQHEVEIIHIPEHQDIIFSYDMI